MAENLDIPELKADPLGPTNTEKLEKGRRQARRRMAWISFFSIELLTGIIFYKLLFNGNPEVTAQVLMTAFPVLSGLLMFHVSVILGYLGVSVAEQIFKR